MHGNPIFRLVIVAVAYVLVGVAVWRVTQPAPVMAATLPEPAGTASRAMNLRLTFTHPPKVFEVRHLGQTLIGGADVMDQLSGVDSFDLEIPVPPEGIDLILKASWPQGIGATATRLRVTVDGRPAVDETFWAVGELADVVTVR